MASVSRPSSGPTTETPHQPRSFSFPKRPFGCYKSASSSLKIHAKIFPMLFAERLALCASAETLSTSGHRLPRCAMMVGFFYGAAALAADMMDPPVLYGSCTIQTLHSKYGRAVTIVSFGHTSGNNNQMRKLSMNSYLSLSSSNFDDDAAVYR